MKRIVTFLSCISLIMNMNGAVTTQDEALALLEQLETVLLERDSLDELVADLTEMVQELKIFSQSDLTLTLEEHELLEQKISEYEIAIHKKLKNKEYGCLVVRKNLLANNLKVCNDATFNNVTINGAFDGSYDLCGVPVCTLVDALGLLLTATSADIPDTLVLRDGGNFAATTITLTGCLVLDDENLDIAGTLCANTTAVILAPQGGRALQASSNGNVRGAGAVDLQTSGNGSTQVASGFASVISGGSGNTSSQPFCFVGGGAGNAAGSAYAVVCGGEANAAGNNYSFVGAGLQNGAFGGSSFVGAGQANIASGGNSFVGSGLTNNASEGFTAVVCGANNNASGYLSMVGGGEANIASGNSSFAGGGLANTASGSGSVVVGGGTDGVFSAGNTASGGASFIGSGIGNQAVNTYDAVVSGSANTAAGGFCFVGNGFENNATGAGSVIVGGGYSVDAIGDPIYAGNSTGGNAACFIGAGLNNTIGEFSPYNTIVSGSTNFIGIASAYNFIGSGINNSVQNNGVGSNYSTILNGYSNHIFNNAFSAIVSGSSNVMNGTDESCNLIGGGANNQINSSYSVIPGGLSNTIDGGADASFAAGQSAQVAGGHNNSFVWSDGSTATVFTTTAANTFSVLATNGARFVTNSVQTSGVILNAGGGAWNNLSDRTVKENYQSLDKIEILKKVVGLPVERWNLKSESPAIKHMGPYAQDFYAAFGLGDNERYINSSDIDGVALAAIQGMYALHVQEIAQLRQEIAELKDKLGMA